jgi:hypothetical protein
VEKLDRPADPSYQHHAEDQLQQGKIIPPVAPRIEAKYLDEPDCDEFAEGAG